MDSSWNLLLQIVVLLGACVVFGGICSRLKQSPLVGYLLAGTFLGGPGSLRLVQHGNELDAIAELGVALLLFSLGLEFSWKSLVALGARTLMAGAVQVVLTTVVAAGAAMAVGLEPRSAMVAGGMICLSSTAAVLRVLADRGELDSQHGRRAVAVLLVQDMAVVPLAIMVELLTPGAGFGAIVWKIGRILLVAGLLVSGLYLVLNYVAVRALRSLSVMHNRELVVLLAVVVGLGSTWAAHAAGLSPALGAFTAGIFLGGSPFAVQVRADVSSIKIVLLTLFFGAVGLVANPVWMGQHIGTVLAVAAAIVVGKAAVTAVSLSLVGSSLGTALATGLCLAQVGEFAFVLGGSARAAGILKEEAYLTLVSATIATLLVTPYLMPLATRIGAMLRKRKVRAQSADESHGPRVLVVGFGPAGQAVGNALSEAKISATVMDVNPNAREMANGLGLHGEIGDATQWDVLEHTVGEQLCLAIITVPDFMAALTIQQHIRRLAPHARLVVRSRYERNETALREAGADLVIGDERQAGGELAAAALLFVEEFRYSQKAEEANAVSLTRSSIGPGLPS